MGGCARLYGEGAVLDNGKRAPYLSLKYAVFLPHTGIKGFTPNQKLRNADGLWLYPEKVAQIGPSELPYQYEAMGRTK